MTTAVELRRRADTLEALAKELVNEQSFKTAKDFAEADHARKN